MSVESEACVCVSWVHKYFKDCLCNLSDEFSFGLGLISLVCWGVAEIPQIITNFRSKSSHGVSLTFLLTWVAGDIFNLVGCFLEPATLPTQLYTALLYTVSTVVLVLQSMYYDYIYSWFQCTNNMPNQEQEVQVHDEEKPLKPKSTGATIPIPKPKQFHYTSARSLAGSGTPIKSYFRGARSGPSAIGITTDSSSDDESLACLNSIGNSVTQPRTIPRPGGRYGTFLAVATSVTLPLPAGGNALTQVYAVYSSRRLLNEHVMEHSAVGQWLGWLMAAIYMGGRLPQIYLNIKRGSVEGLNPLMFVFALVANVAYVASILVRNTEGENIKANMPWLLDAIVCVALDLFIILQYIYYKKFRGQPASNSDYVEATKLIVS